MLEIELKNESGKKSAALAKAIAAKAAKINSDGESYLVIRSQISGCGWSKSEYVTLTLECGHFLADGSYKPRCVEFKIRISDHDAKSTTHGDADHHIWLDDSWAMQKIQAVAIALAWIEKQIKGL